MGAVGSPLQRLSRGARHGLAPCCGYPRSSRGWIRWIQRCQAASLSPVGILWSNHLVKLLTKNWKRISGFPISPLLFSPLLFYFFSKSKQAIGNSENLNLFSNIYLKTTMNTKYHTGPAKTPSYLGSAIQHRASQRFNSGLEKPLAKRDH